MADLAGCGYLDEFVLQTTWGTFLCLDPYTGDLIQCAAKEASINLVFASQDGSATNSQPVESNLKVDGRILERSDWNLIEGTNGYLALRICGHYATAIPTGGLEFRAVQLNQWEQLSAIPYAEAVAMVAGTRPLPPRTAKVPRRYLIPRVINQTFPPSEITQSIEKNIDLLRDMNKDWAYRLWPDKDCLDFIYGNFGYDILSSYLKINPQYGAARADLFRYLLIYKEGGVYLDIKSNSTQPISGFVAANDEFLLGQWEGGRGGQHKEISHVNGGEFQQWHICSSPGHPFLEAVIDMVLTNIHDYYVRFPGVGEMGVLRLTGPIAYTQAIFPLLTLHAHRYLAPISNFFTYEGVSRSALAPRRHYKSLKTPIVLQTL